MRGPIAMIVCGVVAATLSGAQGTALAQSREACSRLQAQLARLDGGGTGSRGGFSEASAQQRGELARAEAAFARCGLGGSTAICVQLADAIPRMRANLARLDGAARRETGGSAHRAAERARLQRALAQAGCNRPPAPRQAAGPAPAPPTPAPVAAVSPFAWTPAPPPPAPPATARESAREQPPSTRGQTRDRLPTPAREAPSVDPAPGGFLGLFTRPDQRSIFERFDDGARPHSEQQHASLLRGGFATPQEAAAAERRRADAERRRERERARREEARNFTPRTTDAPRNTFRTLCVRSCDGYYWPISFATNRAGFARDADVCRASCPNAEVALYVHRNPGEWSEAAVTADGTPYTELATAFRYRTEFDRACQCRPLVSTASMELENDRTGRADGAPPQFALQNLRPAVEPVPAEPEPEWTPPTFDPDALPVVITFDAAVTAERRAGPEGLRGVNATPAP